ncbi:MAG TPA: NADH-quinone oxidoreductase subunit N [Candidatus Acidoferrales bacterium]|nr:NADH-quinone oxidoreductase subunit N [Candidatus Acidoferrales bacterium]
MEVNLTPLLPAAEVALAALVVLIADLFLRDDEKGLLAVVSVAGLAIAAALAGSLWDSQEAAFGDTMLGDNFSLFFTLLLIAAAALAVFSSAHYLSETNMPPGEYHALILFSTAGMILMASANDLILFFLGLETMSIAVYILTGLRREQPQSSEAAMKYFMVGAFATGFLLYGIALIYGATGATHLARIGYWIIQSAGKPDWLFTAGALFLVIGLAFKVAAVPFHFWAPDVYEGAPTSVTAFMAVAVKAAAFAGWARIVVHQLAPLSPQWDWLFWLLAIMTMTLGNLLAIAQSSVKRMLAYSSVAHAGYLLIAIVAGNEFGGGALLFYLLAYSAMSFGAFAVLLALKNGRGDNEEYRHFAGLGFSRPFLAMSMAVFMLSLAGFPPLGGFTGKFYLFRAAVLAGYTDLAIIGVLNSLLSLAYYLRVIVMMYMDEGGVEAKTAARAPYLYAAVAVSLVATFYLGILPGDALELSRRAFASLR